jgi:hypothetical protein
LPVELLKTFADNGNRSMMVETASDDTNTVIRIGNAGIARALPSFVASCTTPAPRIRNTGRLIRQGG